MKIGEFAAFCNLSVRTLRLYDQRGLLTPARIDPATGYRSYEPEQMQVLNAILSYKRLGFSLAEIKALLSPGLTFEALIEKLRDKLQENDKQSDACRYHNETIRNILRLYQAAGEPESDQAAALRLSRIACLENDELEHDLSKILWL